MASSELTKGDDSAGVLRAPGERAQWLYFSRSATAAVVLGGAALFLTGHALFKLAVFQRLAVFRLAALVAMAALGPVSLAAPSLALSAAVTLLVLGVAVWDTRLYRQLTNGTNA